MTAPAVGPAAPTVIEPSAIGGASGHRGDRVFFAITGASGCPARAHDRRHRCVPGHPAAYLVTGEHSDRRATRRNERSRLKAIAQPSNSQDSGGIAGVCFDLGAQPLHMHVHRRRVIAVPLTPDEFQSLLATDDTSVAAHQQLKQPKLFGRKMHGFIIVKEHVMRQVHDEGATAQYFFCFRTRPPAENGVHPSREFAWGNTGADAIVSTRREEPLEGRTGFAQDHYDRNRNMVAKSDELLQCRGGVRVNQDEVDSTPLDLLYEGCCGSNEDG